MVPAGLDRGMHIFPTFCEVSDLFPAGSMNEYWRNRVNQEIAVATDPALKADLMLLRDMNLVAYLDKALRVAGIPEQDLDAAVQDVVVKLLVTPGTLFSGWRKDGPLSARLKASIKNAAITMGQRAARARKRRHELPMDLPAKPMRDEDLLIQQFREWLRSRLGDTSVMVFDWRLAGNESKDLIGASPEIPSGHALKAIVKKIKAQAVAWSRTDPQFLVRVQKLMADEQATIGKRRLGREPVATLPSP